jgi:hypothetical protein
MEKSTPFTTKGGDTAVLTPILTLTRTATQPTTTSVPACTISSSCVEKDCQKIKDKVGQSCTTRDYSCCLMHVSPTPTLIIAPPISTAISPTP